MKTKTESWGIASRDYDRGDVRIATFPEGVLVAKVKRLPGNSWKRARLIAAAPDLLVALKECARDLNQGMNDGEVDGDNFGYHQAVAAIAKAEGK